jgi:hypothetical protein
MEGEGERMYSSYSFMTSALDGVSGQRQARVALYPRGNDPPVFIGHEVGWAPEQVLTQRLEEIPSCHCRGSNLDRPIVQSIARHYTG